MSIASASTTVKFHEFPSGNVLHNYQPGTQIEGAIRSISWSKDGNWLALVPYCGPAEIVSVKDQLKLINTIHGIEEPSCASFQNTTKKNVAIGTKSGQVLLYDIKARDVKKRFPRTTSVVTRVEFTAKDGHVVAACENGEAYIYSNVQNNLSGTFKIPRSESISALRTNPIKRNYVVAGSNEGVVAVWDIHGNKNRYLIGSHKAPVTAVAFSPINSDLVISTGLDRQFCFYDIGGNKCIANVFVENSIASIDCSPDGKFIAMASQKGKIYIYDFKKIQQPVHSFSAHNSAVEHLLFRKTDDYETSFNMSTESPKEPASTKSTPRNTESFELDIMVCNESSKNASSHVSVVPEDSFMAAIGLDNTAESNKPDYSSRPLESTKKTTGHKFTPTNPSKLLQERMYSDTKVPLTSTPHCISHDAFPTVSPIVNVDIHSGSDKNQKSFEDLKEYVKSAVRDELEIVSQELKNDLKYYSTHNLSETRQMYLNLLMAMVKESIKVENNFDSLISYLTADVPQNYASLYEENLMLKQKIAELEDQLSLLSNDQVNKNI